jgi:TPR repeat protein
VIRVTLLPIDDKPLKEVAKEKAESPSKMTVSVTEPVCPQGTVFSEGKCQLEQKDMPAYLCSADDEAECKAQCKAGDDGSCGRYVNLLLANGDDRIEEAKPLTGALVRACEQSAVALACGVGGWLTEDIAKSLELQTKGCRYGYIHSCMELGDMLLQGSKGTTKDPARYFSIMDAACQAGSAMACARLSDHYLGGRDTAVDAAKGKKLALRACNGGNFIGCLFYGAALLTKDECKTAAGDKTLHCDASDGSDPAKGRKYLERACELSDEACGPSKNLGAKG